MGRKIEKERPDASPILSRLLEVIDKHGVKPQELCQAIGASQSAYSSWLQRGTPPGTEQLAKILQFLKADANYVLGVTETNTDNLSARQREIIEMVSELRPAESLVIQGQILSLVGERYLKEHPEEDTMTNEELSHLPVREGDF